MCCYGVKRKKKGKYLNGKKLCLFSRRRNEHPFSFILRGWQRSCVLAQHPVHSSEQQPMTSGNSAGKLGNKTHTIHFIHISPCLKLFMEPYCAGRNCYLQQVEARISTSSSSGFRIGLSENKGLRFS